MDPTAPNSSNPQNPTQPQSSIEPGQFVTAGNDDGVFKEPPALPGMDTNPMPNQQAAPGTLPNLQAPPPQPQSAAAPPQPEAPTTPPQEVPSAAPTFANQPNPAPYAPPPQTGQAPPSAPSTINKLRTMMIIGGFALLVILIGIALWFFVINKSQKTAPTTTALPPTEINLPSIPPARTTGGFSDVPPATPESQQATPPAQVPPAGV